MLTSGAAAPEAIALAEEAIGAKLPPSLARFVQQANAAEGWVAGEYLAMWPVAELANLNSLARVAEFSPELVAFATNGGLEGFFFHRETGDFINSPMIGLGYIEPTRVGGTFDEFLAWLVSQHPRSGKPSMPNTSRFGSVIHEIHPILLGGSPTDPKNKTMLPLATYAEAVGFWNEQVRNAPTNPGRRA